MSRVRVLQVVCAPGEVDGRPAGITGPERRTANLAGSWHRLGIDAIIAYPRRGSLWGEFRASGLPVHDFEMCGWKDFDAASRLETLVRASGVGLIHSQGGAALDLTCVRVARKLGVNTVITRPSMIEDQVSRPRLARLLRRHVDAFTTLRRADAVVAVSANGFARLKSRVPEGKLHLVHNGVKRFKSPGLSSLATGAKWQVGMIGHLLNYKGWKDFLGVAKHLTAEGHDIAWHIVGEGPERPVLEAMSRSFGIADRVVFHGLLHDVTPVLAALDLFLFTSHREGLSVAILEAMSAGLPVIATNVGGIADQVVHGETGYIVKVGDVATAAERVTALIAEVALRKRMGAASRERMERFFSEEAMLSKYASLYRQIAR